MRKIAIFAVAAAALLAGPALQARERLTGEQQLAKLLEGRVAEKPVSCIPLYRTSDSRIIDKTAISTIRATSSTSIARAIPNRSTATTSW